MKICMGHRFFLLKQIIFLTCKTQDKSHILRSYSLFGILVMAVYSLELGYDLILVGGRGGTIFWAAFF